MQAEMRCQETWMSNWQTIRCSKVGKVERDGKHYCTVHDPLRVQRKRAEKAAQWKSEDAIQRELTNLFGKLGPWVKKEKWGYRVSFTCKDERAVRELAKQFKGELHG